MTGLGLGPLIAGLFAEYVAMPTHSVFWAYLGVCALALAALAVIPETVRNPRPGGQPPAAPRRPARNADAVMLGACLGVFAAFSVLGLFSSLVPTFLHGILGVHNLALVGGASFLIFVIAAVSQAVSARLPSRRSLGTGLPAAARVPGRARIGAVRQGPVALPGGHRRGRRGGGVHLPRRPERAEPARRAAAPGRGRLHVLRRRLPRPRPAGRPHRPHLAGGGAVDASAYVSGLVAAIVVVAFVVALRSLRRRARARAAERALR